MNCKGKLLGYFFYVLLSALATDAFAQGGASSGDGFGKNRVQYKSFDWFYYKSYHFDVYYYKSGKELAAVVGKMAEQNLPFLENSIDYKLENRIQILVYNKLSDVQQTNLGLGTEQQNTGGLTKVIGNKLFVYYNGDYADLEKQVRAGIAYTLISELLYGGNLQEKLQNAALLSLPDWYIPGLVSFLSENWSIDLDNKMKDGVLSEKYSKLTHLIDDDALIAGHSIWKYTLDNFPQASISNIIYMTRIYRNAETGFQYNIDADFKTLAQNWYDYYYEYYKTADNDKSGPERDGIFYHKNKYNKKWVYDQAILSPDGKLLAYVTNDEGKYKIWVYDTKTTKTRLVMRREYKRANPINTPGKPSTDPQLVWNPNSQLLAIGYEKKSDAYIHIINLFATEKADKEVIIPMYKYERVLGFSYAADGKRLILSAVKNGQSDLFLFDIPSRRDEQLTSDAWDDLQPVFINNDSEILFSSNRVSTSLNTESFTRMPLINNKDLFIYKYENRSPDLVRVTGTPTTNETQPAALDSTKYSFLSDGNGVVNRYLSTRATEIDFVKDTTIDFIDTTITYYRDSFETAPLTDFVRNIEVSKSSVGNEEVGEIFFRAGRYRVYRNKLTQVPLAYPLLPTRYKKRIDERINRDIYRLDSLKKQLAIQLADTTDSVITILKNKAPKKYSFQTEFSKPIKKAVVQPISPTDTAQVTVSTKKSAEQMAYEQAQKKLIEQQLTAPNLDTVQNNFDNKLNRLFGNTKSRIYLPIFSTSYLVSQLDNSFLNNAYQLFTGTGPVYNTATTNALIKVGTTDLMEDYRFTGGFRLDLGTFSIPEYFLSFENLKGRLDKQIMFYRQGQRNTDNFPFFKQNNYEIRGTLKYPFSEISAVRGTLSYRRDEIVVLSSEQQSLVFPTLFRNNVGIKVEYIVDNTISKGVNLYNGTRYKVFVEQYKVLREKGANMTNLGLDVRHYEKISRQLIAAVRLSAATSVAAEKVIYYAGGVDGWLFPKFNRDIQVDPTNDYVYHALAGNIRGFTQNIRNGNTTAVLNAELRFPVFAYALNRPLRSDFVKNFQIVPFVDAGSAWVGANPFSKINAFNQITINNKPITVVINEPKDPFVLGYGAGLRSRLLGYFIRFDWAYGVVNGRVQPRVLYLSLNLDF